MKDTYNPVPSLMETERSQPEGKRILPERGLPSRPMIDLFFLPKTLKFINYHPLSLLFFEVYGRKTTFSERHSMFFVGANS